MNLRLSLLGVTFIVIASCGNARTEQVQTKVKTGGSESPTALLDGVWHGDDNKGFSIIYNGYFNAVGQDSTGKWDDVHAGKITINKDNTVTFEVLYSSHPDHIGFRNTAEYSLSGENVTMHHFKKVLDAQGKDVTDKAPKDAIDKMTRVR